MLFFALKMLINDRAKFFGILMGITFATFIITQQAGIFIGLMHRTYAFITDTAQAEIWVMDRSVLYIDDLKPMKGTAIDRVRSVGGVEWAVPLYKGLVKARLKSGNYQICNVIGIDNATLIGGPSVMLQGTIFDLRRPDGVIVNEVGANDRLATTTSEGKVIPLKVGDVFEINDRRAQVVGICSVERTFSSEPVIYTTFNRALAYAPPERNLLSYILVKGAPGIAKEALAHKITRLTRLSAYTTEDFKKRTVDYYITHTGILINFGFAVLLGFIIGVAISGQTFYNFALDNLPYFAIYKAMGADNHVLIQMVWVQALFMGGIGYGLGIGLTSLFGVFTSDTELAFKFPWELYLGSAIAIFLIVLLSATLSIRRIINLDPVRVFQR